MSFFDLASSDFRVSWPTLFVFMGLTALVLSGLFATLIVKWKSKVAKVSVIVGTVVFAIGFSFFCIQSSVSTNNEVDARASANAKALEEYALSEYGVELTVTEITASPEPGSLTEYSHSRKGVREIPASGLNVATAVDPETRTAYSFDANKDHEIVLIQNGVEVEAKKIQNQDSVE